jgi:polyphosphate kinase
MQLYRDLSLFTCFKLLKEAVIADFRWLLGMNKISASKIVFLQPRYVKTENQMVSASIVGNETR